jgi:hypothetical protein
MAQKDMLSARETRTAVLGIILPVLSVVPTVLGLILPLRHSASQIQSSTKLGPHGAVCLSGSWNANHVQHR